MGGGQVTDGLQALRSEALAAVRGYAVEALAVPPFVRGETTVPVAGKVIGAPELEALVDASLDGWLTEGRFARAFCRRVRPVGRSTTRCSSARARRPTCSLSPPPALTSTSGRCAPATRSITPALGFSTTVGPLYQYGLVPVYVDVEPDTFNPTLEAIAAAVGDRTRAILAAHCLGNPSTRTAGRAVREHDLVLIEDCCDALGSHLRRPRGGHLRRGGDLLVLSRPPHDDRRGRRRRWRTTRPGCGRSARCANGAATAGARPA